MRLKDDRPGDRVTIINRWSGGLTWMAHPNTDMQRASQALVVDDAVWLIDPMDAEGLDEELADLGAVAGIAVLTNSHGRHADRLAARHDVPIHVPACFQNPDSLFEARVEPFEEELGDTGFELVWETARSGWQEGALYHSDRGTLVMADALMTALFARELGRLEVFPFFQFSPPRTRLGNIRVERVLVGHGEPVVDNAQAALDAALETSRAGAVRAVTRGLPILARQAYSEMKS